MAKAPDFLLIGMEKSGTHWVTAILNAHPDVAAFPYLPFHTEPGKNTIGEVHLFDTLASLLPGNEGRHARPFEDFLTKYNKVFADLVPLKDTLSKEELFARFRDRYNEYCEAQRGGKKLVGESTPAYVFYLPMIDTFYPEIKKLCIIRDPKDRVVSWHFNQIRKGRKTDMAISDEFAKEYCESRIMKEYESLLAYSGSVCCFTYEQLHAHQSKTIVGVLDYLGVWYDDAIIGHMIEEGSFASVIKKDGGEERKPGEESLTSHYRKGIVGDWQNNLTEEQGKMIDDLVGDLQTKVFEKYHVTT